MVKDIIDGIKNTEAQAAGILEEARKQKADLVARAKEDARKIVEEAETGGRDIVRQALDRAKQDAAAKVEEIAAREAKDLEAVRAEASGRVHQAVDIIIKKITG
jgi:vacuolar-type H+-ATPase subunit H